MAFKKVSLYRASIVHFSTCSARPARDYVYWQDGGLAVCGDTIEAVDSFAVLHKMYPLAEVVDYRGKLIIPGLIDSHVHFGQTEMIASYGEQLMAWLTEYTFPTEAKFADPQYCEYIADVFIQQLVKNGTTTALVYPTVHAHSVDALFTAANKHKMAMITGKVCMDKLCPDNLHDSPELAANESEALINRWHNKGRNYYALTPRFAPTSSAQQLAVLGELAQQYPDVFIQSHLSENLKEIALVKSLFPEHETYLDVYDHYNLVRERTVFGHGIHLPDSSWQRLAESHAVVAFCPSSNLFLGSGLFNLKKARKFKVNVALASDVGAGTSFNMLKTYGEAYKVCQLQQLPLNAMNGLYMMTQGAAAALKLEHSIGNLNPGTHADFVVLNPAFDALSALRNQGNQDCEDTLFALAFLADDRAITETYIAGKPCINSSTHKESGHALA